MKVYLYSIFDRISHTYGSPFPAVNDDVAVRQFNYMMKNNIMVAEDCELYKIGELDTENGNINAKVTFVCAFTGVDDEK